MVKEFHNKTITRKDLEEIKKINGKYPIILRGCTLHGSLLPNKRAYFQEMNCHNKMQKICGLSVHRDSIIRDCTF